MWKCKCGEMNPDSSGFCQSCGNNKGIGSTPSSEIMKKQQEKRALETERLNRERIQQTHNHKMDNLIKMGYDGYYEYKVISLLDESGFFKKNSGAVNTDAMAQTLNQLGLEGWHLVTAYSNELGKNALSGGMGGAMLGVNSTVDENILIFERFIRIKDE